MSDYKKTLNIPKNIFPMKADLVKNSSKFINYWSNLNIYEESLKNRKNNKKFILHDGPPYANGNIHLGHALNKILKDFIIRYKSARGFKVEYIPGWDTHGLPIENKIEKTYPLSQLKTHSQKRNYCREYANSQIKLQKSQFLKLNLFSSFKDTYETFNPEYIKKEYEILLYLFKISAINWELKPVNWSWSSKTALAESEIIYKNIEEESIYFFFPSTITLNNTKTILNILIWTTTPYTLESNRTLGFNPSLTYLIFKYQDQYFLITKNRYQIVKDIFGWENTEIIEEHKGKYFENISYTNPLTNKQYFSLLVDYITDDTGTGIVHMAPGFGLEDYYCSRDKNLEIYCPLDDNGIFLNSDFPPIKSLFYKDASPIVIEYLKENKFLIKKEKIVHSVGHDWRTLKPTIYRATKQWFLNIKQIKNQLNNISSHFQSKPEWISKKLEELLLNRDEWCLSRQRAWGIPIPILFDNENPILDLKQIEHIINLLNTYGVEIWYEKEAEWFLLPEYKEQNYKYTKSTDILDVWFDSGTSWMSIKDSEKCADIYLEGFDQLRGWFNSSSIISLFFQNKLPFKKIISHGFVLDDKGNKMSKSLGNVIDPLEIIDKYGADIFRLWIAKSNYLEDIRFSEQSIQETISLYRKIRNTLLRYPISILSSFHNKKISYEELNFQENKYIWLFWEEKYKSLIDSLEQYNFSAFILNISLFIKVYSSWYLEITKDILYCSSPSDPQYIEISEIISHILHKTIQLLSIIIPQTSEEAYGYIKEDNEEPSIFLKVWDKDIKTNSFPEELDKFKEFLELKDRIYLEIEKLKEKKEISGSWEASVNISSNLINKFKNLNLRYILNIADINIDTSSKDIINISPSKLSVCLRCKKFKKKKELKTEELCERCWRVINISSC